MSDIFLYLLLLGFLHTHASFSASFCVLFIDSCWSWMHPVQYQGSDSWLGFWASRMQYVWYRRPQESHNKSSASLSPFLHISQTISSIVSPGLCLTSCSLDSNNKIFPNYSSVVISSNWSNLLFFPSDSPIAT